MYQLREYQKEAVEAAVRHFERDTRRNGVIVLPTGAGKSLVIANIAYRLDAPVLVFQPSKEILEQNYAKLCSYGVLDTGIFSASFGRREVRKITFATIGSVKNYKDYFRRFRYAIIDECHNVNAEAGMYKDFIDTIQCKVLGLTATPYSFQLIRIDFTRRDSMVLCCGLSLGRGREFFTICYIMCRCGRSRSADTSPR